MTSAGPRPLPGPRRRRGRRAAGIIAAAAVAAGLAAVPGAGPAAAARGTGAPGPATRGAAAGATASRRIAAIMRRPAYRHGRWGLLEVTGSAGRTVRAQSARTAISPGALAGLFPVAAAWSVLGGGHRFVTPVYAVGSRSGDTLTGNLVLVASGDQALGGRTTRTGRIAFTSVDHSDAGRAPGAALTPQNPLAGLTRLARQVRLAGITQVAGNVIIDTRLFAAPAMSPAPAPVSINDNLIDVQARPGRTGGPARLSWRPHVAPYQVTSTVRTVRSGGRTRVRIAHRDGGTRIAVSGTIAAGSRPVLRVSPVASPAAFARTAFFQALNRAGVSIGASPTGANPAGLLPHSYAGAARVAAYTSPSYAQFARFILKTGDRLGANLAICLLAAHAGRHDCQAGFAVLRRFLRRAGVSPGGVQLADGGGASPADRVTPAAVVALLRYWLHASQGSRFRRALPALGENGTLAASCAGCPARGRVFAAAGRVLAPDLVRGRLTILGETAAGYLDTRHGRPDVFFAGVGGGTAAGRPAARRSAAGLAGIAAILQEAAARGR